MNGEIQKSFSLLLYSFRLHTDWRQLLNSLVCEASIWQKSRVGINEQFLFSHVEDYYNRNSKISTPELANIDTSQCVFFELKDSLKNSRAQCSFEKLFNLSLVLEAKEKSFSFRFYDGLQKGILSPKLLIVPYANIGLLSFSLELEGEERSLQELVDFNYTCRLINTKSRSAAKIALPVEEVNQQIQQIFESIRRFETDSKGSVGGVNFTFAQLVAFFLADVKAEDIEPLTPKRFHIFSYVQTQKQLSDADINSYMFYLSRIYNANYQPTFEKTLDNPEVIQTFKNIYIAVSIEGGCILVNENEAKNSAFFENYLDNVIKTRYLWIYFLAYQQRIALINTAYSISNILRSNNYSIELIFNSIEHLSKIQLSSMFAEISYIKMHNDFYALCRNSFKVPELHKELRDELFDLNLILQQQFEHQRQLRENEEEILRRKNEEKQSKFESRLNLAVFCFGLLTFISVWKDFTDMVSDGFRNNEIKSLIELGGVIIVLVLVVFGLSSIRRKK